MEQAVERCPWNRHWRSDLVQAYRLDGRDQHAAALARTGDDPAAAPVETHTGEGAAIRLDYLFLSGDSTCSSLASVKTSANC
jgi:endonuclease/exonuclease/phosphatase family metal-dependent hydrolase